MKRLRPNELIEEHINNLEDATAQQLQAALVGSLFIPIVYDEERGVFQVGVVDHLPKFIYQQDTMENIVEAIYEWSQMIIEMKKRDSDEK